MHRTPKALWIIGGIFLLSVAFWEPGVRYARLIGTKIFTTADGVPVTASPCCCEPSPSPSPSPSPCLSLSFSPCPSVSVSISVSISPSPSPSPTFQGTGFYCIQEWAYSSTKSEVPAASCADLVAVTRYCIEITTQAGWDAYQFGTCIDNSSETDWLFNMTTTGGVKYATEDACNVGC